MTILAELFNPSFFMLLAILLLVASMFIIYYESKMREQNHTINSMLSLVSTLAEDMENVKFGLNQMAIRYSQPSSNDIDIEEILETSKIIPNYNLIEVSDDESDDDDDESNDDESDNDESDNDDAEFNDSSESDDESECNIKVLKLNILNEADLEECEMTPTYDLDESKDDDKYVDKLDVIIESALQSMGDELPSSDELKTIAIDLGEEQVDYSKIPISKLKKIAVEKGVATTENVSKLKKQDLINLIEVRL